MKIFDRNNRTPEQDARRYAHRTDHDAGQYLSKRLAAGPMGLRCTQGQIKAGAKTLCDRHRKDKRLGLVKAYKLRLFWWEANARNKPVAR